MLIPLVNEIPKEQIEDDFFWTEINPGKKVLF